jgi:sulfide:quinone oxidoreductase
MNKITQLTPHLAVTGGLLLEDVAEVAAMGFRSIVSNLPDGESAAHPTSRQVAQSAERSGLGYRHIPTTKADVFSDRVVDGVAEALSTLEAPVLMHCASGLRSAVAWAAAAARSQSPDDVLVVLRAAGFNLDAIRDDLAEEHDPGHDSPVAPALRVAKGSG